MNDKIAIGIIAYFAVGWILATLYTIATKAKKSSLRLDDGIYGLILLMWPVIAMCAIVSFLFEVPLWLSKTIAKMIVHGKGGAK